MDQSRNALTRMQNAKNNLRHLAENGSGGISGEEAASLEALSKYREKFIEAMDDDLNTADANNVIF